MTKRISRPIQDESGERVADERVEKENKRLMSKCFCTGLFVMLALLAVKAAFIWHGAQRLIAAPELLGLCAGCATLLILYARKGLWGQADERILAEKMDSLCTAWRNMDKAAVWGCIALFILRADDTAYMPTVMGMAIVRGVYHKRLVKAGLYHHQVKRVTKKSIPAELGECVTSIVQILLAATVMNGELLPTEAYIMTTVIFAVIWVFVAGRQWVQELVSEQNEDEQLRAAEDMDEE